MLTAGHTLVSGVPESCVCMTGSRRTRTVSPVLPRPLKATLLSAGALVACASVAVGCGVIPGATGGSGDDSITVMTWAPEQTAATNKPGMPAMAKAYARWVNSRGGINGRKLKVLTCNDHNDNVDAANCARRAVDENVVAVVGSYSQHGRSFLAPWRARASPTSAATASPTTSSPAPCPTPSTAASPRSLPASASSSARPAARSR